MEVIWTKNAKQNLNNYYINSRIHTKQNLNLYIISLIEYVDTLAKMPKLGKIIFTVNNIEIRQIIYKMHRILYSIRGDKINILTVAHTARDYKEIVTYIREYLKND